MTKKTYFYCYSKQLRNHLADNGIRYLLTARSVSSYDQFWLYEQNVELNKEIVKFGVNEAKIQVE